MSIFNWFTASTRAKPAQMPPVESSQPSSVPAQSARHSSRKAERHARRELLHQVVRECMVRVGVLSSAYKFKVLALDQRGRQFLVMLDLAAQYGGDASSLAEIEALIAQTAKSRFSIIVAAVYWRINEQISLGRPSVAPVRPVPINVPEWTAPEAQADGPKTPAVAATRPAATPLFDPIQDDEVAAFQRALTAAAAAGVATAAVSAVAADKPSSTSAEAKSPQRSYTLLTGYEDTEVEDADFQNDALGGTQYGALN